MRRYGFRTRLGIGILILSRATLVAAQPVTSDLLGRDVPRDAVTVAPPVGPNPAPVQTGQQARHGNPLWEVPIKNLTATRDRPVFSPSRRPPPPVVAVTPHVPPRPPEKPARPQLTLLGTVLSAAEEGRAVNAADGIGVFLDQTNSIVVRLKTGDYHNGWFLRSVQGREATLQKDRETVVLALPTRGTEPVLGVRPAFANISGVESTGDSFGTPPLKLLFDQYH